MVSKRRLSLLLPITLFLIALALRLYHLPLHFPFTADEEYQATYARTIVQDFHPVWIGVSAADTGFYLGPYFTYLTAFLLSMSHGDPLLGGYTSALLGAITSILLYYLAKQIAGTRVGYSSALLYCFSPLMIYFDQRFWNPSPSAFLVCLLLLSLLNLRHQKWWLLGTAFSLGAMWHVHLALVPLYLVACWMIWESRSKVTRAPVILALVLFCCMLLPLLIFDYNHAWSNLLTPVRLLHAPSHTLDVGAHLENLGETFARFVYLRPGLTNDGELRNACIGGSTTPPVVMTILALLPLIIFLYHPKTWQHQGLRILAMAIVVLMCSFVFYPGPIAPYYALGLIPLYFMVLALLFQKYWQPLLLLFMLLALQTVSKTDVRYGLAMKRDLIDKTMQVIGTRPFSLIEDGDCHKYAGWRYLFLTYGRMPKTSTTDASLGWLYPHEIGEHDADLQLTLTAPGESIAPNAPLYVITSGGYTAYITKNK